MYVNCDRYALITTRGYRATISRVNRDTWITVQLYNCISIMHVVFILFVFLYLLVPLISIPCIVKMYVCIAPVTQLTAAECIFE